MSERAVGRAGEGSRPDPAPADGRSDGEPVEGGREPRIEAAVAGSATIGRIEVPAADPEAAARFFAEAFGWRAERVSWEGGPYLSLSPPSGAGAGVTSAETLGATAPLAVIHVDGPPLEQWLERIAAAGGTVEAPPREVGDFGRFARFRDPEGHLFGLWSARRT